MSSIGNFVKYICLNGMYEEALHFTDIFKFHSRLELLQTPCIQYWVTGILSNMKTRIVNMLTLLYDCSFLASALIEFLGNSATRMTNIDLSELVGSPISSPLTIFFFFNFSFHFSGIFWDSINISLYNITVNLSIYCNLYLLNLQQFFTLILAFFSSYEVIFWTFFKWILFKTFIPVIK